MSDDYGTLKDGEPHPSALSALEWIKLLPAFELLRWQEAFSSCAISGNRLAIICSETLRRLMDGEPVSDRYLLGLAWSMRYGIGEELKESKAKTRRGSRKAKSEVKDQDSGEGSKVARGRKREESGEGGSSS